MERQQIFNEIKSAMVTLFEVPESVITHEARLFEDLELDSIDAIDLIVHVQKVIKKKVNPEDFKSVRTIGDIEEVIYRLVNNK
ncbi:acyl carrier protein [Entomomonas moraniae]|uniref:Acyl carrier protein n=2 Tax=Entomomonas moraniae TaxID=2213226 RepID=A0A3Q9JIC0_9GAMM|nr:acyl carrier protein [Entomomonas moraniae]